MDTCMSEEFELKQEEIPVVKHYAEQILENCKDWGPEGWVQEFVPPLEGLVARITENPDGPIMLLPEEGEGLSALAQDVVSFRAGPEGEEEEIFFRILDKIENDGEVEEDEED